MTIVQQLLWKEPGFHSDAYFESPSIYSIFCCSQDPEKDVNIWRVKEDEKHRFMKVDVCLNYMNQEEPETQFEIWSKK